MLVRLFAGHRALHKISLDLLRIIDEGRQFLSLSSVSSEHHQIAADETSSACTICGYSVRTLLNFILPSMHSRWSVSGRF